MIYSMSEKIINLNSQDKFLRDIPNSDLKEFICRFMENKFKK